MSRRMKPRPSDGGLRPDHIPVRDDDDDEHLHSSHYRDSFENLPSRQAPAQRLDGSPQNNAQYAPVYNDEDIYDDGDDDDDADFYGDPNTPPRPNVLLPQQHPQQLYTPAPINASQAGPQQNHLQRTPSPPPLLDHSHLQPGDNASLLSYERTLALYRENAKKTNLPGTQYEFAVFMLDAVKSLPIPTLKTANQIEIEKVTEKRDDMIREATLLLKRLADRGHSESQYFLADCYSNGIGTVKGRQDFDRAFPLFVLAAKHGHPDAAYRAGTCCENGWGCRRESSKAVQFYKKSAAALHPGAMYRLGIAELNGELGLTKSPKEGVKWLMRSAEHATAEFPHALHELALLHERGVENVVFVDFEYSVELLAQAAELGYAPSAYRLGECYEYGKLGCPQDPALSIHYYNIAAQQNHRDACFALTAWYLVGSPGVLPQSDTEAYLWAKKAAEQGLTKAQYAIGYFTEVCLSPLQNDSNTTLNCVARLRLVLASLLPHQSKA
ncbi:uncharacterized protein EI90DRAFT_3046594 [Cantharellus anzutake]|uniref:uncharacterized protein n=1 Tax=Cantharellus anzutake TaxID=1750568 RepID=UPI0019043F59|nr:uncharacterized protein EI90DRAFT_3046594 [Cantharellus anzutake]KAF8336638.1 hypothetical protein EI90DRAFT_3046594 [Cantharellus anzutake]